MSSALVDTSVAHAHDGTGILSIVCCDRMIVFLLPLYVIMSITRPISIPISSFVRHGAEKSRGRKTTTVYEFIRRGTRKRSVRPTVGSGWDLAGTMVIGCHAWVKKCTRGLYQKLQRSLARSYKTGSMHVVCAGHRPNH